jgi:hypothetical protein
VSRRRAVGWELLQLRCDLIETEADSLREDNEGNPAEHRTLISSLAAARAI